MARTQIRSGQVGDAEVGRADLNTATSGAAVIAKAVQGTGISLSSTGADAGTGDVTINVGTGGITYALLQDIAVTKRALGRNTAGAGDAEEVTASQILDWISATPGSTLVRGATAWEVYTVAVTRLAGTSSASGNTTILAAQGAGNKIAVYAYALQGAGTVAAKLTDGAGGADLTLAWSFQAREGITNPNAGQPLWIGTANTALVLNLSAAIAVGYEISYAVTT